MSDNKLKLIPFSYESLQSFGTLTVLENNLSD